MLLDDYAYVGKLTNGPILVEIYDTLKKTFPVFGKKIYAYQIFDNNKLICENHTFIPNDNGMGSELFNEAYRLATEAAPLPAVAMIEHIECFEVVQ